MSKRYALVLNILHDTKRSADREIKFDCAIIVPASAINTFGSYFYPSGETDENGLIKVQLDFDTTEGILRSTDWDNEGLYELNELKIAELIRFGALMRGWWGKCGNGLSGVS